MVLSVPQCWLGDEVPSALRLGAAIRAAVASSAQKRPAAATGLGEELPKGGRERAENTAFVRPNAVASVS